MSMRSGMRICVDSTTLHALRGFAPVGLSRVESHVLWAAIDTDEDQFTFCAYDRYRKRLEPVSRGAVAGLLNEYGKVEVSKTGVVKARRAKRGIFKIGNQIEKAIRHRIQAMLGDNHHDERGNPSLQPGDYLVLTGNAWDYLGLDYLESLVLGQGVHLIVFVHDIIPILFPHLVESSHERQAFEDFMKFLLRHALTIICISKATQRDLMEWANACQTPMPHCVVVPLGTDPVSPFCERPESIAPSLDIEKFVLSVGAVQIRKNRQLLYQIWRRMAEEKREIIPTLVIAGGHGRMENELVHQIQNDPLTKNRVLILGHVSDDALHWLYANCEYTLYPSLYEGWGLPITESLMHSKPCIASNTSSMPEAGQGLAIHLDPYDFSSWYRFVVQWNESPELVQELATQIQVSHHVRSWGDFQRDLVTYLQTISREGLAKVA